MLDEKSILWIKDRIGLAGIMSDSTARVNAGKNELL